ncbi:hypothetical protein DSO57_1036490 [Entomophthora muscae]|uniref:Uncharacterized protein n=2 Tax=Entomophthora muscae TaxID=34485 RepID=A0ACC2RDY4_9FUNG|nr:hypothetical protein DSO57_1036642 [Entomophthora muscae]KAJ9083247.1 hypothetical protein DSO57_1036490 [Entomophthora muscae]
MAKGRVAPISLRDLIGLSFHSTTSPLTFPEDGSTPSFREVRGARAPFFRRWLAVHARDLGRPTTRSPLNLSRTRPPDNRILSLLPYLGVRLYYNLTPWPVVVSR